MIWWIEADDAGIPRRWTSTPAPAPWVEVETDLDPATVFLRDGAALPLPPWPGPWAVFDAAQGAWTDPRSPEVLAEALVAEVTAALEAHVETVARQRQYSGGVSAASYVSSTNALWAAEAAAFVAWRDALWAWALQELSAVRAGAAIPGDPATIIAAAPTITWPEETS